MMNTNDLYTYDEISTDKLYETLELVRDVFMEFEAPDYSEEGIEEFLRFLDPVKITDLLLEYKMRIWICECNNKVVGMIAAREEHINLLFVSGEHHRKGIARRLLKIMVEYYDPPLITVNSSPFAVEAYRKMGFSETGPEQEVCGIRFIPMKKEC